MEVSTERQQLIDQLQRLLANTYLLYIKTQGFHWNVVDARFYMLHKLFEEQYEELADAIDLIAEHIRTYNVLASGSMRQMLELGSLQESNNIRDGDVMVAELYNDHCRVIGNIRQAIDLADKQDEDATSDVLVGRLRAHDKTAWMLRSHLPQNSLAEV